MSRTLFIIVVLVLIAIPIKVSGQGGTSRYVYDDNGRLRAVVGANGEANIYDYDAAGNFTGIRRVDVNFLTIFTFYPKQGVPGDSVTILGLGFGGGVSSVSFNGTSAQIVSFNQTTIVTTVPNGATTGPITVTTPNGSITSLEPFTIKGVSINPTSASLTTGETLQFSATVFTTDPDTSVNWRVNGILGGNSTVGTITQSGLFTAPNLPFQSTVRATSNADPTIFADAQVTLRSINGLRAPVSAGVLVNREVQVTVQNPTYAPVSAGVLVNREVPVTQDVNSFGPVSAGVLVQRDMPITVETPRYGPVSAGVLVQRDAPTTIQNYTLGPISAGVLIMREEPLPPTTNDKYAPVSAGVLVRRDETTTSEPYSQGVVSSGVLVQRETSSTQEPLSLGIVSSGVLVNRETTATQEPNTAGVVSAGVLVNRETTITTEPYKIFSVSDGVLVLSGPAITATTPAQLTRDSSATLTITGINLSGATQISFIKSDNTVDTLIAASNLSVNQQGTTLTATVTVGPSAAVGIRYIVLQTIRGQSIAIGLNANVVNVQ